MPKPRTAAQIAASKRNLEKARRARQRKRLIANDQAHRLSNGTSKFVPLGIDKNGVFRLRRAMTENSGTVIRYFGKGKNKQSPEKLKAQFEEFLLGKKPAYPPLPSLRKRVK